MEKKKV